MKNIDNIWVAYRKKILYPKLLILTSLCLIFLIVNSFILIYLSREVSREVKLPNKNNYQMRKNILLLESIRNKKKLLKAIDANYLSQRDLIDEEF